MPEEAESVQVERIDEWLARLHGTLGLPATFVPDRALLLDVARDAAHGVARPAAPLTTFLVGLAAGIAGGSTADVERATETARRALERP